MGIFGTSTLVMENELKQPEELLESYIYDEISRLSDEKRQEFVNSQEAQGMLEAGLISRKTLVRLSKNDDLERRIGMAAIQLSKESDDALYDQLVKVRIKERELLDKINAKYANRATRVAKIGQKDYLKNKMPVAFIRK